MRFEWTEVRCNNTQYLLKLRGNLLGENQAQFDLSSYWTSTNYYEIPLPCGSAYTATVESRNEAGTSEPSVALTGNTGRLHFICIFLILTSGHLFKKKHTVLVTEHMFCVINLNNSS